MTSQLSNTLEATALFQVNSTSIPHHPSFCFVKVAQINYYLNLNVASFVSRHTAGWHFTLLVDEGGNDRQCLNTEAHRSHWGSARSARWWEGDAADVGASPGELS